MMDKRRKFLRLCGLVGAGTLAGCSEVSVDEPAPNNPSTSTLGNANFTFEYIQDQDNVRIQYNGDAEIAAEDLQVRSSADLQVQWSQLGSTVAEPSELISPDATAVLGENVINWEQPVGRNETIRLVHTGGDAPTTLGRFTPPESSPLTTTVPTADTPTPEPTDTPTPEPDTTAPSISAFSISNPSERTLRTSFESDEPIANIEVNITGPDATVLTETDFSEAISGGIYSYEATYEANSDGDYTAELDQATDESGNDGAVGQSVSLSVSTTADTDTGVQVARQNSDGEIYQVGELANAPETTPTVGESITVTIDIETEIADASDNIVYGVLGTTGGDIYGIERMDGTGAGSVTVSATPPTDSAGNRLIWTWVPATSLSAAETTFQNAADDGNLYPDGDDDELSLGTIPNQNTNAGVQVARENSDGAIYQVGELATTPDTTPTAGESISVTIDIETRIADASDNIVYGVLGTTDGDIYGIERMDGTGSGSVTVSATLPTDSTGNTLIWTWVPATSLSAAETTFQNAADGGNLYPDGDDDELSLGTIQ